MTARKKKKAPKPPKKAKRRLTRKAKAPARKKSAAVRAKVKKTRKRAGKAATVKRTVTRVLTDAYVAVFGRGGAPSAPVADILEKLRGAPDYAGRALPGAPLGIRMAGDSDTERRGKPDRKD